MSAPEPAADKKPVHGSKDWVGMRAMAWVLDDAPVSAQLLPTLIAIARRADENGKSSYQSRKTLAAKTGKSEDQIKRDIKALLEQGLIVVGDQSVIDKKIPFSKRPVVYDVALHVKGPKPMRGSKNPTGEAKSKPDTAEAAGEDVAGMDAGGGTEVSGGMEASPWGCMEAPSTRGMDAPSPGGMEAPQTILKNNPLNKPLNTPSLSPSVALVPTPRGQDRERDLDDASKTQLNFAQQCVIDEGTPEHLSAAVVAYIEAVNDVRGIGWWITAKNTNTVAAHVPDALAVAQSGTPVAEAVAAKRVWAPQQAVGGGQKMPVVERRLMEGAALAARMRQKYGSGGGRPRLVDSHANPERYLEDF